MSQGIKRRRGGSFRELREQHLPLFDLAVHRHDRGWPHLPKAGQPADAKVKPVWKRVDIFHFFTGHDDQTGEKGNANSH